MMNERGQSVFEYVFLMAVLVTFSVIVFNSQIFTDTIGPDGAIFNSIRKTYEYSYRYGLPDSASFTDPNANPNYRSNPHPSYFHSGETRFFIPTSSYVGR